MIAVVNHRDGGLRLRPGRFRIDMLYDKYVSTDTPTPTGRENPLKGIARNQQL
jgi:hypothetical protein